MKNDGTSKKETSVSPKRKSILATIIFCEKNVDIKNNMVLKIELFHESRYKDIKGHKCFLIMVRNVFVFQIGKRFFSQTCVISLVFWFQNLKFAAFFNFGDMEFKWALQLKNFSKFSQKFKYLNLSKNLSVLRCSFKFTTGHNVTTDLIWMT